MKYPLSRAAKGAPLSAEDHDANLPRTSLKSLLGDRQTDYPIGSVFWTIKEGWRYEVLPASASRFHLTTAGGIKLKVLPEGAGFFNFLAFNPPADGAGDDLPALLNAIYNSDTFPEDAQIEDLEEDQTPEGGEGGQSGVIPVLTGRVPSIYFPAGDYRFNDTLVIKRSVRLFGDGVGSGGGRGATLRWPVRGPGIVCNGSDQWKDKIIYSRSNVNLSGLGHPTGSVEAFLASTHSYIQGNYFHVRDTAQIFLIQPPDSPDFDAITAGDVKVKDVSAEVPPWFLGDGSGSAVDGLRITGPGRSEPGTRASNQHGIWMRRKIDVKNVFLERFPGDGIAIVATRWSNRLNPKAPEQEGNVNNWSISNVRIQQCGRSGIRCEGKDANAGTGVDIDCSANGQWGIADHSFLGNKWYGCHANGNGTPTRGGNSATQGSWVSYEGQRYYAHPNASFEELVNNAPGASTSGAMAGDQIEFSGWGRGWSSPWTLTEAGGTRSGMIVAWQPGQEPGTYRPGGAYCISNQNSNAVLIGAYMENNNRSAFHGRAIVMGGIGRTFLGHTMGGSDGGILKSREVDTGRTSFGNGLSSTQIYRSDPDSGSSLFFKWNLNDICWGIGNSNSGRAVGITGTGTTRTFGRAAPVPMTLFGHRIALGDFGSNARIITYGDAPPAEGNFARGEIIFSRAPSPGGFAGWICTQTGSPGTWKGFGRIDL
jgi:hypothetical protein